MRIHSVYTLVLPCMVMKPRRQSVILQLIDQRDVTSQEQLRELLKEEGIEATQATLSRDIRDLGLVKRAVDGAYRAATGPEPAPQDTAAVVRRAVGEYLRRLDVVEQLIVLKTDPGQAQSLAIALDRGRLPEVVGTIGGDDTILVICRSATDAATLSERLDRMRS
jgi:transcriptional regulator of arginine metabolism